VSDLIEGNKK